MSFLDGKPHFATKEDLSLSWAGGDKGKFFRCYYCGHKFIEGDYFRFIFSNDTPGAGGNPLTCKECDTGDRLSMVEKWKQLRQEFLADKFWFFRRYEKNK